MSTFRTVCISLLLVAPLADVATAAPRRVNAAKGTPHSNGFKPWGLSGLVEHMCKAGHVDKVLVGEWHGQPVNLALITQALIGAERSGPCSFWREMNFPTAEQASLLNTLANPAMKHLSAIILGQVILQRGTPDEVMKHPNFAAFERTVLSKNVTLAGLLFIAPARRDMSAFLAAKGRAVGSAGLSHWEFEFLPGPGDTIPSWGGDDPYHEELYMEHPEAAQLDMWGGLFKAINARRNVISIRATSVYDEPGMRGDAITGYAAKGLATFEMPFNRHSNVSVLVPGPLLQTLLGFIELMPNTTGTALYCEGIEGCPTSAPDAQRDEL